jgi:hypothetical protein
MDRGSGERRRETSRLSCRMVPGLGPGHPVRRGARPGWVERGHAGGQPQGPGRPPESLFPLGAVAWSARGGPGVAAERVRGAEPGNRHPHRGGPGTALGSRRPGRDPRCRAAGATVGGGLAIGAPGRRHQDGQVTADAGAAPGRRAGSTGTPEAGGPKTGWRPGSCGRITTWRSLGTPLDAAKIRREFRKITEAADPGVGWAPRDLRHTFVSLMSADGVLIEEIARLAGHNRTATTELVYRYELRAVITTGAEVMDRVLDLRG